jgi:hypothetical protein
VVDRRRAYLARDAVFHIKGGLHGGREYGKHFSQCLIVGICLSPQPRSHHMGTETPLSRSDMHGGRAMWCGGKHWNPQHAQASRSTWLLRRPRVVVDGVQLQ